jgi:glutathione S-transferase
LQARLWDRFGDHHLATPMQKIVGDSLRPEGRDDPEGVAEGCSTYGPSIARVVEEARPFRDLFPLPWPADQDE